MTWESNFPKFTGFIIPALLNHLILRDQGVDRRLRESLPTEEGPRAADALQVFEGVEVHLLRPLSDHNRGGGGVSLDLQRQSDRVSQPK